MSRRRVYTALGPRMQPTRPLAALALLAAAVVAQAPASKPHPPLAFDQYRCEDAPPPWRLCYINARGIADQRAEDIYNRLRAGIGSRYPQELRGGFENAFKDRLAYWGELMTAVSQGISGDVSYAATNQQLAFYAWAFKALAPAGDRLPAVGDPAIDGTGCAAAKMDPAICTNRSPGNGAELLQAAMTHAYVEPPSGLLPKFYAFRDATCDNLQAIASRAGRAEYPTRSECLDVLDRQAAELIAIAYQGIGCYPNCKH